MDHIEAAARLNDLWDEAPKAEKQGQHLQALALWQEALSLKQQLGITGAGDVGEMNGIQSNILRLEKITKGGSKG